MRLGHIGSLKELSGEPLAIYKISIASWFIFSFHALSPEHPRSLNPMSQVRCEGRAPGNPTSSMLHSWVVSIFSFDSTQNLPVCKREDRQACAF